MSYGSPYGPSMVDQYGQDASHGLAFGRFAPAQGSAPRFGGGMLPMQVQGMHTGGPGQMQGMAPNILTGVGLPPQMVMQVGTGGPGQMQQMPMVRTGGYDAPQQQIPQNRLGGFGGGYNFGLGGLLR